MKYFLITGSAGLIGSECSEFFIKKGFKVLGLDNNSRNGMIVNGYKVNQAILKNGDIIEITDVSFTFYI